MHPVNVFFFVIFIFSAAQLNQKAYAEESIYLQRLDNMQHSSLLVDMENGHSLRSDLSMIPASTTKVLTALLALETWETTHRFTTDFYIDAKNILWIKGYGDPFLISEEIDNIVSELWEKGLNKISGIGVDDSYFSREIFIDGQSSSDNPYDAPLGALAANFNTVNVHISQGRIQSAEEQTPLTPLAISLSRSLPAGEHRINLGQQQQSAHYFAELIREKLIAKGVSVNEKILSGKIPESLLPFYQHRNSHDLATIISAMLQYSNNFIANQLFLLMGVANNEQPATMEKAQTAINKKIKMRFGWQEYNIIEGAGLSRKNRLTARQLIQILQHFKPYRELLSQQNSRIHAKSGTLKGISTYAGYLQLAQGWIPFALMINQPIEYDFRKRLADSLLTGYN